MKDLKYIAGEISKGKNLDINLEKYATGMCSFYNTLACIKLAMNYYTVYDMYNEHPVKEPLFNECFEEFNSLVAKIAAKEDIDIKTVDDLRNKITGIMESVTSFVDRLRIYAHALNRIEYRFRDDEFDKEYYNTYLTNDLMHYILSDKDNVVIHSKIAEVVGQLPMRLSRNKFYEYLRDAFSLYHGAQKGTIDDFAYSLKTTATIHKPEGFDEIMPEMHELVGLLENADYTSLDKDEYKKLHDALQIGAEKVTDLADYFVLLAQMVNDLYTILLTGGYTVGEVEETNLAFSIIEQIVMAHNGKEELSEDILEDFTRFEGKQERILSVISQCDYAVDMVIDEYKEEAEKCNLLTVYEALKKVSLLQSGSDFVELEKDKSSEEVPQDLYADEVCESLIDDLKTFFESASVPVRRAVMATLLSQLPVFFNNTDEIQNYINVSLMQCTDDAEAAATVEVLKLIINS